jgi:hypothetical protein
VTSAGSFNSNEIAFMLNRPGAIDSELGSDHCRIARVKLAPILRCEFATAAYEKTSVFPSLKERYCSDARGSRNARLIGYLR